MTASGYNTTSTVQTAVLKREAGVNIMGESRPLPRKAGGGGKFIVDVKFLENATWQGSVVFGNPAQEMNFRSALELLKIMDSALEDGVARPEFSSGRKSV